jgi:hypothetical protein
MHRVKYLIVKMASGGLAETKPAMQALLETWKDWGQTGWDEPLKMLDESKDLREFLDKMKSANL